MRWCAAVAFFILNSTFAIFPVRAADTLAFASEDGRYSFTVDCSEAPDLADWAETKLKRVVAREYGRLADEFACEGYCPRKEITYRLKNKLNNPGIAHGSTIDLHVSWIRKYIDNRRLGMVIHETWHVLERYRSKAPSWLKEGIADWVRFYHYEHDLQKVNLKTVKADDGYAKTAAFLAWCNGPHGESFVRTLIRDLRTGDYDHATWWQKTTGLSFDELETLWKSGRASPLARGENAILPLRGIVLWPDQAAAHRDLRDAVALEFSYVKPSEIVTAVDEKGRPTCDWRKVDALLDAIASRGHQAILRLRYEYPGELLGGVKGATAVPAAIKARADYHESFAENPNGDGPTWYADWSNLILQSMTIRLYRELAARYDADPRLAFIEIGFGHWSEYHIEGTRLRLGRNFPSLAFQQRFLLEMADLWRETPWLISIDAADESRAPIVGDRSILDLGFGLFDDSFMCAEHDIARGDGYNERCWRAFGATRWQSAPAGGEINYDDKRDQLDFLGPKGVHGVTWSEAAKKYHLSFIIANDVVDGDYASAEQLTAAAHVCGWDFRLVSRRSISGKEVLTVVNCGNAPAYHDIRVRLGSETSNESLKGLLPGAKRTLSFVADSSAKPYLVSKKFLPEVRIELKMEN